MDRKWMQAAACKGALPHNFYLFNMQDDLRAIRVCVNCPVQDECLEWAVFNGELGVWGGTTTSEREQIRVTSMVTGIPMPKLRRNMLRVSAQDWHSKPLQHNKPHVKEHPASAFLSPSVRTSIQQMRIPAPAEKLAALLRLSFHSTYRGSVKNRLPFQLGFVAS